MKKTLTLLAMMLLSIGAMAQLEVIAEVENTIEELAKELMFDSADSCYYVALTTSNSFDKSMIFAFGKGKISAMQTIDDILAFMKNAKKHDMIKVDNGFGKVYEISKYDNLNVIFNADGFAGYRLVYKPQLKRWRSYIEDHGKY